MEAGLRHRLHRSLEQSCSPFPPKHYSRLLCLTSNTSDSSVLERRTLNAGVADARRNVGMIGGRSSIVAPGESRSRSVFEASPIYVATVTQGE